MIEDFKFWFKELEMKAIAAKRCKAKDPAKWKKEIWKAPEKNKQIKEKFTLEGKAAGYRPSSSFDRKAREWLYDLIWREFDVDDFLISVPLTMEIELSDKKEKNIRYDFNKLLQADSKYKVFVFQQKTAESADEMLSSFEKIARKYKSRLSAKYLICCWCTSKNEFMFHDFDLVV
jgi:hypothetical protein